MFIGNLVMKNEGSLKVILQNNFLILRTPLS